MSGDEHPTSWFVEGAGFHKGPFVATELIELLRLGRIRASTRLVGTDGVRCPLGDVPEVAQPAPWAEGARAVVPPIHVSSLLVMLGLWGGAALHYLVTVSAATEVARAVLEPTAIPPAQAGAFWNASLVQDPETRFSGIVSRERFAGAMLAAASGGIWMVFVLWLRKVVDACAIVGPPIRRARGELWWVWFVPILNLYRPIAILRQIDRTAARHAGVRSWTPLVVLWWGLLCTGFVLDQSRTANPEASLEQRVFVHLQGVDGSTWAIVVRAVAAALIAAVALRITRNLDGR